MTTRPGRFGRRGLLYIAALAVLTIFCLQPATAEAHYLEKNNGISAVLHIPPDDNAQAGKLTQLDFTFSSQSPGFDLRYCACKVSLQTSDDRLTTASITSADNSAVAGYTSIKFPSAGVYDLAVQGFTSGKLQERFKITYRIRAAAVADQGANLVMGARSLQVLMLSLTGLVLLGVIAWAVVSGGGRYNKPTAAGKPRA